MTAIDAPQPHFPPAALHLSQMQTDTPLLRVSNLSKMYGSAIGCTEVDFSLWPGEVLGIVGESGSGKSQTVLAAMGLLADNGTATGSVMFNGTEMLTADAKTLRDIRGDAMSMIFQNPLTSLTPHMTVGAQMREVLKLH